MKTSILIIAFLFTISFHTAYSQDTIPNGGFEIWYTPNFVSSWQTTNLLLPPGFVNCTQTSNSHSGDFAMQMKTINMEGSLIPAVATLGTVGIGFVEGGIPFTSKPLALHVFLRHPSYGDEIFVAVQFFNAGEEIGVGSWATTDSIADYTEIIIPIAYTNNLDPDTMNITMLTDLWAEGSMMHIDDMEFEYEVTATHDVRTKAPVSFYPNPCTDRLFNQSSENIPLTVNVYRSDGHLIKQNIKVEAGQSIDVGDLPTGIYILHYFWKGELFQHKFIKQ